MDIEPETGGQFILQQNYHNPFITATTFAFTLTQSATVKLFIFDLTGKKLATLLERTLPSGQHQAVSTNLGGTKP